jgi:uncharacterized membrane protein (DUF4010 family)
VPHPAPIAQAIGVRTFVLLGLLGTLAAKIGEPALTLGLAAFALAAILAGYVRSTRPEGGLVIGVLLIAVASAQRAFGPKGAQWVAMLGGLFELQGVSLATAVLLREGHVALEAAGFAIALAIVASFLSKFGILWFLGRRADFALRVSAGLAAMLAAGTGAWMLLRP